MRAGGRRATEPGSQALREARERVSSVRFRYTTANRQGRRRLQGSALGDGSPCFRDSRRKQRSRRASTGHFNPRSPCGERLQHIVFKTRKVLHAEHPSSDSLQEGKRRRKHRPSRNPYFGASPAHAQRSLRVRTAPTRRDQRSPENQSARKPSASYDGFAPWCSILFSYEFPRL